LGIFHVTLLISSGSTSFTSAKAETAP
jgi:hypothetical protein